MRRVLGVALTVLGGLVTFSVSDSVVASLLSTASDALTVTVGALTVHLGGRAGVDVLVRTDLLLHSVEPCQLQARTRSVYAGFSTKLVKSRVRFVDASASDAAFPKDRSHSLAPLTAL